MHVRPAYGYRADQKQDTQLHLFISTQQGQQLWRSDLHRLCWHYDNQQERWTLVLHVLYHTSGTVSFQLLASPNKTVSSGQPLQFWIFNIIHMHACMISSMLNMRMRMCMQQEQAKAKKFRQADSEPALISGLCSQPFYFIKFSRQCNIVLGNMHCQNKFGQSHLSAVGQGQVIASWERDTRGGLSIWTTWAVLEKLYSKCGSNAQTWHQTQREALILPERVMHMSAGVVFASTASSCPTVPWYSHQGALPCKLTLGRESLSLRVHMPQIEVLNL